MDPERIERVRCELRDALIEADLLACIAPGGGGHVPIERKWRSKLDEAWDIASSQATDEHALAGYERARGLARKVAERGRGTWLRAMGLADADRPGVVTNTCGQERAGVAEIEHADGSRSLKFARSVPSMGARAIDLSASSACVPVVCDPAERTLSNGVIEVRIDTSGHVVSLRRAGASHEIVAAPLNQLVIVRERTMDDEVAASGSEGVQGIVWSSAESKRRVKWRIGEQHPLRAELVLERRIGEASTIEQTFRLDAGSPRLEIRSRVEWREGGCTLRADFPVGLEDATLTCGERACHAAGVARDVIQQQEAVREERMCDWIDVSRPGLGCTILAGNGCGCSCEGSSIAVSLLRTPLHVDSDANDVEHAFAYAVMPHEGDWHVAGVVAEAESMRRPLRGFALEARAEGVESAESTIDVFTPIRVVPDEGFGSGRMTIESIRRSADDARLIVQVRECQDASSRAALSFAFDIAEIAIVDALGRAADDAGTLSKADVPTLTLGPLQTVTLAITPADRTLRV